jgi:DNA-binding NarL/FixJ family response regulator
MPVGRLRKAPARFADAGAFRRLPARPIHALVVDPGASDRRRICRLGRQAADVQSKWIEAADAAAAARVVEAAEIDFVIAASQILSGGLDWLKAGGGASRPAPFVVILSEGDEPQQIQQLLDSGADCLLSRRLPQSLLEDELRGLVARSAARLGNPGCPPIPFPKGNCS